MSRGKETIRMCKLDDGLVKQYVLCVPETSTPKAIDNFRCIGKGTIHTINGVKQSSDHRYVFYI